MSFPLKKHFRKPDVTRNCIACEHVHARRAHTVKLLPREVLSNLWGFRFTRRIFTDRGGCPRWITPSSIWIILQIIRDNPITFFFFKKILFIQNHCIPKGQAKICLPPSMFKFSFSFAYSFNLAPGDEMEGKHRVKKVSHGKVALLGTLRSSKTVIESIVSLHVILIFRENHVWAYFFKLKIQ